MQATKTKVTQIGKVFALTGIVICVLYVLNPTAGLFELLPDTLPVVGNIDETFAVLTVIALIRYLRSGQLSLPKR